ncbi:hypothetical protein FOVSG1_014797 [Fusarium oxysporum f. sp. vasinfectum]
MLRRHFTSSAQVTMIRLSPTSWVQYCHLLKLFLLYMRHESVPILHFHSGEVLRPVERPLCQCSVVTTGQERLGYS